MNRFNYVQPADSRLSASFQGFNEPGELPTREKLYNDYALPHESLEDFCERMSEDYGPRWTEKLIGKYNNFKK